MRHPIALTAAIAAALALSACQPDTPAENRQDVQEVRQEAAKDVAETRQEAAQDVAAAQRDVADAANANAGDVRDEQADAIAALLDREHDLKETLRREISEKQNELRKLLWQKEPDQAAIDAKWEELQALREELFSKTQGLGEAMDEVLTDELLDKLSELRLGGEVPGGCGMGRGNMPRFRGGKDLEIRARGF